MSAPILFMVFNRPDSTRRVFETIRRQRPEKLYISCDGPRIENDDDRQKIVEVLEICQKIDWPCTVSWLVREENLGCKKACVEAISWLFENETRGIILEDDCLPHPDFFRFCHEMLDKYEHNCKVWQITGNNFQAERRSIESYYFSNYNHLWGWATWRRAWRELDFEMDSWPAWRATHEWKTFWGDKGETLFWETVFDRMYNGDLDTWDYPWVFSIWKGGGLTVTPAVNLVTNIGFGADATHTHTENSLLANMPVHSIGKVVHPKKVERDVTADTYVYNRIFGGKYRRFPYSLLKWAHRVAMSLFRAKG